MRSQALFGRNPEQEMDTDLEHMRAFIECDRADPEGVPRAPQGNGRSDLSSIPH